jgi:hypothetical protein
MKYGTSFDYVLCRRSESEHYKRGIKVPGPEHSPVKNDNFKGNVNEKSVVSDQEVYGGGRDLLECSLHSFFLPPARCTVLYCVHVVHMWYTVQRKCTSNTERKREWKQ